MRKRKHTQSLKEGKEEKERTKVSEAHLFEKASETTELTDLTLEQQNERSRPSYTSVVRTVSIYISCENVVDDDGFQSRVSSILVLLAL